MANSKDWKEKAKVEYNHKKRQNLKKIQVEEVYLKAFKNLEEINIDKKNANAFLKVLRGGENGECLFHRK